MGKSPTVSVVVPVHNAAPYLQDTFDSVFAQDIGVDSLQVIAVDDGSTDDSLRILRERAERDPLEVIAGPASGSAAAPRNTGIERATGDYIFFLDADDRFDPAALRRLVDLAEQTGSDIVLPRVESFGVGTRSIPRAVFLEERFAADFIDSFAYRSLGPWKLFRRSLIERHGLRFPGGYHNGEDQPFVMAAYLLGNHISAASDRPYYWIRNHEANTSRRPQSPQADLAKNLGLARVIREHLGAGERRDTVLIRPVVLPEGLPSTFGARFPALAGKEQERLAAEAIEVVGPMWSEGLRAHAAPEVQVLLDLLFAEDLDGVREVGERMHEGQSLELRAEKGAGVYTTASGRRVEKVAPVLAASLRGLTVSGGRISMTGSLRSGVVDAPDEAAVVWHLRHTTIEHRSPAEVTGTSRSAGGTAVDFRAGTPFAGLDRQGIWDAYGEARWGSLALRHRLGAGRGSSLLPAPLSVGVPVEGVVFLTEYGNLSLDRGPTGKHPDARAATRVALVRSAGIGRSLVVLEGDTEGAPLLRVRAGGRVVAQGLLTPVNGLTAVATVRGRVPLSGGAFELVHPDGRVVPIPRG